MFSILLAEDDSAARLYMKTLLERAGYDVTAVENGADALSAMQSKHIDMFVLDVMMPKMDGFTLTSYLRTGKITSPILLVTAKGTLDDKKEGFLSGADDYLVKPFEEDELLLRISALLRRAGISASRSLTVGNTTFEFDGMTVDYMGEKTELPQKEFLLIYRLLSNPNRIFTRRSLMDEIWSMESDSDERTVDVHINRLRERFKDDPDFEIITVRGLGYKAVAKQ